MALLKDKSVIIYGLGADYEERKDFLHEEFHIVGYSDAKNFDIDKFVPLKALSQAKCDYIYITTRKYYREIKEILIMEGVASEKIVSEAFLIYLMLDKYQQEFNDSFISYPHYHLMVGNGAVNVSIHQNNIYEPIYPCMKAQELMQNKGADIYNKDGERMDTFFIRSNEYMGAAPSKYFMWDYYNYKLDIHFYKHSSFMEQVGNPEKKYILLSEPRELIPNTYETVWSHAELCKEFDAVFTWDEKILNEFPNAKLNYSVFVNWYGMGEDNKKDIADNFKNKKKNISIIASEKRFLPMHIVRQEVAKKCKREGLADTYGAFDGGQRFEKYEEPLEKYRYQIVIENDISAYNFSEKITSCFAAQTIPIYLGATKINQFFNMDGIISIKMEDLDHIEDILKQCTEKEYERRLPAILDNYNRLKNDYNWFTWDYFYEKYFQGSNSK